MSHVAEHRVPRARRSGAPRLDVRRALELACEGGATLHALTVLVEAMEAGNSSIYGADAKIVLQSLVRHGSDYVNQLVDQLQAAESALEEVT